MLPDHGHEDHTAEFMAPELMLVLSNDTDQFLEVDLWSDGG